MEKEKTKVEKVDDVRPEDKIPAAEKVFYGLGAIMDGGGVAMMSCIMVSYMNKILGIPFAIAGLIFMLSKLWDAITDPLMGLITDGTRSRFGRRKPYIFTGGILLIVSLFFLFAPIKEWGITSQGGLIAWMLVFYVFWSTCSTISQVPYTSMANDISPSFKERNNANTVKLVFSALASGLAYVVPLVLLEIMDVFPVGEDGGIKYSFLPRITSYEFWIAIVVIFGVLFGGGLILCGIFTKERIKPPAYKEKIDMKAFWKSYGVPFKNKSYRWHIVMYVSAFTCLDILSALAVYYADDVWAGQTLFGMEFGSMFIVAPLMVAAVIAFPLARIAMDKKNKQFAFRMGLPCYILGGILLAVMDPSWAPPIIVPIISFLMGLGFGGAQMMPWIIFPDTLDVAALKTGEKPTGNYSGMMTLIRKISGAVGVFVVTILIDPTSITGNTSLSAVTNRPLAIRLCMGIFVAVLISIAFLASFRYKVNNKKLIRCRYLTEKKAKVGFECLTKDEMVENNKLCDELYGGDEIDIDTLLGKVVAAFDTREESLKYVAPVEGSAEA